MEDEFLIKVVQKQTDLTNKQILHRIANNFTTCYSTVAYPLSLGTNDQLLIRFLNSSEIITRTEGLIELCDYFIKAFVEVQEIDRFQYFQRVLQYRSMKSKDSDSFLILKYQTDMQNIFRGYFQFLNQFFPFLDLLIYIEEVEDGFMLFFEREYDFYEYLFNITSESSLQEMVNRKNLAIPDDFFQKMVNVVNRKLMVSD